MGSRVLRCPTLNGRHRLLRPSVVCKCERLFRTLQRFGFGSVGLSEQDFVEPDKIVQLGIDPYRIDIITGITGVSFDEAWNENVPGEIDGVQTYFLTRQLFRKNKLAAGRPKDLADLDAIS